MRDRLKAVGRCVAFVLAVLAFGAFFGVLAAGMDADISPTQMLMMLGSMD